MPLPASCCRRQSGPHTSRIELRSLITTRLIRRFEVVSVAVGDLAGEVKWAKLPKQATRTPPRQLMNLCQRRGVLAATRTGEDFVQLHDFYSLIGSAKPLSPSSWRSSSTRSQGIGREANISKAPPTLAASTDIPCTSTRQAASRVASTSDTSFSFTVLRAAT